jgi:hypothetical protein
VGSIKSHDIPEEWVQKLHPFHIPDLGTLRARSRKHGCGLIQPISQELFQIKLLLCQESAAQAELNVPDVGNRKHKP